MSILRHNNPEYLAQLKAKRIADKLSRTQVIYDIFPTKHDYVNLGLVVKYRNGSNTQ